MTNRHRRTLFRLALVVAALASSIVGAPIAAPVVAQTDDPGITLTVPHGPHDPGDVIEVGVNGLGPNEFIELAQCPVGGDCEPTEFGFGTVSMTVRRFLADHDTITDCSATPCEIRAFSTGIEPAPIEVTSVTPAVRPSVAFDPTGLLAANSLVDIAGEGFDRYRPYSITWCVGFVCEDPIDALFSDDVGRVYARIILPEFVAGNDCTVMRCAAWISV